MRHKRSFALIVPLLLSGSNCSGPDALGGSSSPHVDSLGRTLLDICPESARGPDEARCFVKRVVRDDVSPLVVPAGLRGHQVPLAYDIPAASASDGAIVAIVDVGGDTTVLSDLETYRTQFGLRAMTACAGLPVSGGPPCLAAVNQTGGTALPPSRKWETEIALDTQMVSAACPDCSILLVLANTQRNADLDAAVDYAASVPGVVAISNSYGWPDSGQTMSFKVTDNSHYDHPGILMVASSGDSDFDDQGEGGTGPSFPASSPHVLAVGGTMLAVDAAAPRGWSESVWNVGQGEGTGSGCSEHYAQPAYQAGLSTACPSHRITNDVSAAADFTEGGVLEYCGASAAACGGPIGWVQVVGTSASAPMVAGFFARLKLAGKVAASRGWLYKHASAFNDVTSGKNAASCTSDLCQAGAGWDGPTGLGTPNGVALTAE